MKSAYIHLKHLENLLEISHYSISLHSLVYVRVMHKSALRLNLCVRKLCVEEMCSSCVFISTIMLNRGFL